MRKLNKQRINQSTFNFTSLTKQENWPTEITNFQQFTSSDLDQIQKKHPRSGGFPIETRCQDVPWFSTINYKPSILGIHRNPSLKQTRHNSKLAPFPLSCHSLTAKRSALSGVARASKALTTKGSSSAERLKKGQPKSKLKAARAKHRKPGNSKNC